MANTTAALIVSVVSLVVSGAIAFTGLAFAIWRYFRETADKTKQTNAERYSQYAAGPQQALLLLATFTEQHQSTPGGIWAATRSLRFPDPEVIGGPVMDERRRALRTDFLEVMQALYSVKGFWTQFHREQQHFSELEYWPAGTWRMRANNFRELAEPFDIANFYLSRLNVRSGPYLDNRPSIYDVFERKWCEHLRAQHQRYAAAATARRGEDRPAAQSAMAHAGGEAYGCRQDINDEETSTSQQQEGQRTAQPATAHASGKRHGSQRDVDDAEASASLLEAVPTYLCALPWAQQAHELGDMDVGDWTPVGPALRAVAVPLFNSVQR